MAPIIADSDDEFNALILPDDDLDEDYLDPSLRKTHPVTPRSRSDCSVRQSPIYSEKTALKHLIRRVNRSPLQYARCRPGDQNNSSTEIELSDFIIYVPENSLYPFEFSGLQNLLTKKGHDTLLFDGILKANNSSIYVEAVPFEVCSIGNYGRRKHSTGGEIWIRSVLNIKSGSTTLYKLTSPAKEYKRYYDDFLWIADLAKHFVDFSRAMSSPVSTNSFRIDFYNWLTENHGTSVEFRKWFERYGHKDFRSAVGANINFLLKEAMRIDKSKLEPLPIFSELLHMTAIPQQKTKATKTIVTPLVYDCFSHMPFGGHLKSLPMAQSAKRRWRKNLRERNFVEIEARSTSLDSQLNTFNRSQTTLTNKQLSQIKVGDVLAVTKDGEGSIWKDEPSRWKDPDECWYMYVQDIYRDSSGKLSFDGIWLYRPSDTSCAMMKYPFPNEIFFSNHCTCESGRIPQDEVLQVEAVDFHTSTSDKRLFIRQAYIDLERFETFDERHKVCQHRSKQTWAVKKYEIGQPVQAKPKGSKYLEAYEVIGYEQMDMDAEIVKLRRLLRRNELEPNGTSRPNELVYSDEIEKFSVGRVKDKCHIRFYTEEMVTNGLIPTPYNSDGTGNFFYISTRLTRAGNSTELQPIHNDLPKDFIQGFDPLAKPKQVPMRGLDLYHGSGNFGRGVAEGGVVINRYACDNSITASHTYLVNDPHPSEINLFLGSTDDYLTQAINGNPRKSKLIPQPGEVDHLTAGSPCKGFSLLNTQRNSEKSQKDQSLIASVAAHIDFFRPKYGLIENVLNMASKVAGRDEDVASQLVCAIVGMGYQLQIFVIDAWSCGSPQSRSRIFISFAAPGLQPLDHPTLSHSHPPRTTKRAIGVMANGQQFGRRRHVLTPFQFKTAEDGTADLPDIGDGHPRHCTPFPDHIMTKHLKDREYKQIDAIPTNPRGMSFWTAWEDGDGVMSREERELFPDSSSKTGSLRESVKEGSRAWGRVHPRKLFPNIVVSATMQDARMGSCLHWDEPRYITIQEARRAQGFPDHEVLVGAPAKKMELVGNAVARQVALALGLATRLAYEQNEEKKRRREAEDDDEQREEMEGKATDEVRARKRTKHSLPTTRLQVVIRSNPEKLLEYREIIEISSDSDDSCTLVGSPCPEGSRTYVDLTS
ncbi:S-adenosyl-L-methionine-dependent methyltransferase [Xylogone sp. PMI_703]|nr:S-adenosyl-L-methionine-dependent methyltransferase [Xylogone sp. PMI_703]